LALTKLVEVDMLCLTTPSKIQKNFCHPSGGGEYFAVLLDDGMKF